MYVHLYARVYVYVCPWGGTPSILMDTTLEKLGHDNNIYYLFNKYFIKINENY